MKYFFFREIDKRSKGEMINYLKGHFRYYTMNYWNRSTSYANNVKLHRFSNIPENAYEMLEYMHLSPVDEIIAEFNERYAYSYQIGFNGRSGGYIVLYQGGIKNGGVYIKGLGIDEDLEFDGWDIYFLRERVKLVQDFDLTCDKIVNAYFEFCRTHKIEEQPVTRIEPVCIPA